MPTGFLNHWRFPNEYIHASDVLSERCEACVRWRQFRGQCQRNRGSSPRKLLIPLPAGVAKLADAQDLKSESSERMEKQVTATR